MANLHELLGRQTEATVNAEARAEANFRAVMNLAQAILRVQNGEQVIENLRVCVLSDSQVTFTEVPYRPDAPVNRVAEIELSHANGVPKE